MASVHSLEFQDGHKLPAVGLGTLNLNGEDAGKIVKAAVDAGYRHLDCAYQYGNEKEIGKALKQLFDSGIVKREDIFITTKLWNTYHKPDKVQENCKISLNDLGLDYINLYLIHWPTAFQEGEDPLPKDSDGNILHSDVDFIDTWKAMQNLVDEGLVKSIGVSNFNSKQLQRIIDQDFKHKIACNQVEISPYFRNEKLLQFCNSNKIVVSAYAPLGSQARPWATKDDPVLLDEPCIAKIAERCKKTPAQVVLRWGIQRGYAVLPKTASFHRLKENINVFDFNLTDEEMTALDSLNYNVRNYSFASMISTNVHYPFNQEY